ncbi:MAG: peptidylprolyl isomerase, partial [Clostridia bacterium]|nr:peptidylprolyl isomerase [Clostridia bacterium]
MQEESYLATAYYEKLEKDTTNAITEEQINTEYNNNQDKYNVIDARIYTMAPITAEVKSDATAEEKKAAEDKAAAETKANAEKFIAAVTDEASFITLAQKEILFADNKSTVKAEESTLAENVLYAELESLSEDLVKWAYDDSRKVGDKGSFKNADGSYTLIYINALPHKDMSVSSSDVRHILVQFETKTDADGKTLSVTATEKAKCKAEAQAILDEYKKNPTVENFAKLAKEKTDDGGSRENGGLYEKVADDGQYVEAFTKWAVDSSRKPGDTGIVETEYGYHVMYYVKANDDAWYAS